MRARRRRRAFQIPLMFFNPSPDAWAVHRTAIEVALSFDRARVSAARAKDRQTRLRGVFSTEEDRSFSAT